MSTNVLYVETSWSGLATSYPHTPENLQQSMDDFLEAKFTGSWICTSFDASSTLRFIFTKKTVLGL